MPHYLNSMAIILAIVLCFSGLVTAMVKVDETASNRTRNEIQHEAVMHGVATYTVDTHGIASFSWIAR